MTTKRGGKKEKEGEKKGGEKSVEEVPPETGRKNDFFQCEICKMNS